MKLTGKHVDFLKEPKECSFGYNYMAQCPGWVIGEIRLPLVLHSNLFFLIQTFSGELCWMPLTKVDFHSSWSLVIRNIAPLPPKMDKWDYLRNSIG